MSSCSSSTAHKLLKEKKDNSGMLFKKAEKKFMAVAGSGPGVNLEELKKSYHSLKVAESKLLKSKAKHGL